MFVSLEQLQKQFQAYLLNEDQVVLSQISSPHTGDSAQQRLNIYSHAYQTRLIDTLITEFPKVHQLLGVGSFHQLAKEYLYTTPSRHYSIDFFGEEFTHFIKRQAIDYAVCIAELAEFEWALSQTMDAISQPALSISDFQAIPQDKWPNLHVLFQPSLKMLHFSSNAVSIWEALDTGLKVPSPEQFEENLHYCCWQNDFKAYYQALSTDGLDTLTMFLNHPFATVCEHFEAIIPEEEVSPYLLQQLVTWLQQGLIAGIDYSV